MRAKAALIVMPVLLLGYLCSSRIDMAIAAFVILSYLRTQMKQADVSAVAARHVMMKTLICTAANGMYYCCIAAIPGCWVYVA